MKNREIENRTLKASGGSDYIAGVETAVGSREEGTEKQWGGEIRGWRRRTPPQETETHLNWRDLK